MARSLTRSRGHFNCLPGLPGIFLRRLLAPHRCSSGLAAPKKRGTLEEVNIVVTGFSPWGPGTPWPPLPVNTSWEIANSMPRVIFRRGKPNIRVVIYPDAVRTSWTKVRQLIPRLWTGRKDVFRLYNAPGDSDNFEIHALLHIGMLDKPNEAFRLERNGYKRGYDLPDVDGKYPTDDDKSGGGTWGGVPNRLATSLDIDSIHKEVAGKHKDAEVVISEDHPRFLCGYIYFSSLAHLYNQGEKRRLLFLHVPIEHGSEDIGRGVSVATSVLEAMADRLEHKSEQ